MSVTNHFIELNRVNRVKSRYNHLEMMKSREPQKLGVILSDAIFPIQIIPTAPLRFDNYQLDSSAAIGARELLSLYKKHSLQFEA